MNPPIRYLLYKASVRLVAPGLIITLFAVGNVDVQEYSLAVRRTVYRSAGRE